MRLMRKRPIILSAVVGVLGFSTFVLAYALRGPDPLSRAATDQPTPDLTSTPVAITTPDTLQPYWYVAYENAERAKPKFDGELAGVHILSQPAPFDPRELCSEGLTQWPGDALDKASSGPTGVKLAALPDGIVPVANPEAWVCGSATVRVVWLLEVKAGTTGVEQFGSGLSITRTLRGTRLFAPASEERWTTTSLERGQAALLKPIIAVDGKFIGGCTVAYFDTESNVLTVVRASAASPEFCVAVANEVTS